MSRLVIYGTGGLGRDLLVTTRAERREVVFMTDDPASAHPAMTLSARADLREDDAVVIAVADTAVRRRLAAGFGRFGTIVAPTAIVCAGVPIGPGAMLLDQSIIEPGVTIGTHFVLHLFSYVAHDCTVGDFVTVMPRVGISGYVQIGDGALLGTSATIRPGAKDKPLTIGRNAIVGMGSVVMRDVPANCVVMGNPARVVRTFPDPHGL